MPTKNLKPQQLAHLLAVHSTTSDLPVSTPSAAFIELFDLLNQNIIVTQHTYPPGAVVFQEGDDGTTMFLIQAGQVAVVKGDWDDPIVLAYRAAGEIIGEMALLENRPRSASVVALEAVDALCVDCMDLRGLLSHHPDVAISVMSTLSARLRSSDSTLDTVTRAEEQLNAELEVAARIQARLLPREIPAIPGWDIAAQLTPARKTSGDYYDVIALSPHQWGILVADVVDKGAGAALYMAVSRTLIRTFARQYPTDPAEVLRATNDRIQEDIGSEQFVTVFYGVLDSETHTLLYANAGHNPAFLLNAQGEVRELGKTGIPIGMFQDVHWHQPTIQCQPGDRLIAYTDGVSEARDSHDTEYGTARLLDVARAHTGCSAQDTLTALFRAIQDFIGAAAQFDDITLLVAVCE